MGTFMSSVSFRRTDKAKWLELKPIILEKYQGIDGLVGNLEQEREAYAIVSPYGDMGMFLQEMPETVSRLTGDYAVFCICVDSDIALLELYHNGQCIEKSAIGHTEFLPEVDELEDVKSPDIALWKPLLQDPNDAEILQKAFTAKSVFVEDQLREISSLTGLPIFDDALVFEDEL